MLLNVEYNSDYVLCFIYGNLLILKLPFQKGIMRIKKINVSSDSDNDDDIPLKTLKLNGSKEDPNAYESLCKQTLEACEFCDKISNNRYSSLIHNVKHIIIPLLNQTVFQCPTCLHSFTSQKDLIIHGTKKHPEAQKSLVHDARSTRRPSSQSSSHSNIQESQTLSPIEDQNVLCIGTKKNDLKLASIRNRLVFEEDLIILDCDQLLNDLTTDCKVNLEVFDTPWMNGVTPDFTGTSVHYEELIKPGVYRCKKCGKGFPIRYDAIVHETSHIELKNTQVIFCDKCNKYIVGGKIELSHHHSMFHKVTIEKKDHPPFEDNIEDKLHNSKILSLCGLCFSFCKNTINMNYECVDTISKIGNRFVCEKCGQLFFEINLVKRSLQRRKALYGAHSQKKRIKTNEDRLKTIANRFKMMKH